MSRHPQADLIKEWSEDMSRVVQFRVPADHDWLDCGFIPAFDPVFEYRFKPEPKPDVVRYAEVICCSYRLKRNTDNLKLTFDGETGKLIKAEVIE